MDSVRVLSPPGLGTEAVRVGRASTADARFRGQVRDLDEWNSYPSLGRKIGAGNSSRLKVKELKPGR